MKGNDKYYKPSLDEFYMNFEFEMKYKDKWEKHDFANSLLLHDVYKGLERNDIRVKYLDHDDIIEAGFKQSLRSQWIGYTDFYSGDVLGEYGYFLYITLHFPRNYIKSDRLEDNLFKIILHRYYVSNKDITTNIDDSINRHESQIVYVGKIKNKNELIKLLKQLGIK